MSPDCLNSELGLHNYSIFRRDRSPLTSNKKSGGGVMVAVHSDFSSSELESSVTNVEHIFVRTKISGLNVLIGSAYIPPNSSYDVYSSF